MGVLVSMMIFVIVMASPFLSTSLFTSMTLNENNIQRICYGLPAIGSIGGVLSNVIGSLLIVVFCEIVAVPVGIGAAIYLAEYAGQNRITSTIRFFIETLAGAPSVIIGIIGFAIFTTTLHWGFSLYSGGICIVIYGSPMEHRISEEALKSVPKSYREGSFALGATQWQTARLVTLYAALPNVITGILLGIGVALGETLVLQMNYSGELLTGLPSPWWHIFNFHQQLPSLTTFILREPGGLYTAGGFLLPGGTSKNVIFLSYSLSLAVAAVLILIYLVLCIGALLLRNYLRKRMTGN